MERDSRKLESGVGSGRKMTNSWGRTFYFWETQQAQKDINHTEGGGEAKELSGLGEMKCQGKCL